MIVEDNRKNLESTARIIKRANISKDFALVFAVCNSLEEQENYIDELRQTCNKQDIVLTEVKLLEIPPVKRLFPVIKEHLKKKFGDTLPAKLGIQVTGLELSILLDEDEQVPVVLQILNMNRESFYKDLPFPFVFWLPEYACIKVANAAPDFWSFRVGTPTFCSDGITGRSLPEHMENGRDITVWQDKLAQIPVLERLLDTPQSTWVRVNLLIKSGEAYSYIGKTENARQRFEQAIEENEKANEDPQWAAEAYNKLGIIYSDMGVCKDNLEKAAASLQKYLEIVERAGRKDLETMGYNHLGLVYDKQKKYRQALRSYKEALEISRTYGHRKAEGDVLGNMGLLYRKQRKYEDALKMHQHALTISRELDDIQSEALDLSNIGLIYYEQNAHKHAVDYFNQALFRNNKTGNKLEEMNQLIHLGDAWKALGDFSTALEKYLSAKAIAEEINIDIFIVFDRLAALFGPGAIDDTAREILLLEEAIEKSRQLRETARILCYLEKMCSVYRNQSQVTEKNNCLMKMEGILRNNIQRTENEDELRGYYEELMKIYKELGKKRELKTCRHKLGQLNDRQLIAWLDPGTVDMLDIDNQPVLQVGKTYNLNFQIVRTPPKQSLIYQGKIPPFKKVQKKSHIREVSPIEGRRISEEEARHFVPDKKSNEMLHEKNTVYSHEQDYHIPSEHQGKIDSIRYPSPPPYMSEQPATSVSFRFTSPGIGFDRKALDVLLSGNNISDIGSVAITPKSTGDHRISVRIRAQAFEYKHDIKFPLQAGPQIIKKSEQPGMPDNEDRKHVIEVKFNNIARYHGLIGNSDYYDWEVYVDEENEVLDLIESVEYVLHESFPNRIRRITNSRNNFSCKGTGWGGFMIDITVYFKNNTKLKTNYFLDLSKGWNRNLFNVFSKAGGVVGEEVLRQPVPNPYEGYSGLPVIGSTFSGRADIMQRIENHWATIGQTVCIILYGHRRMGKTSILRNLSHLTRSNTLYVYLDMQNAGWVDHTGQLLLDFAEAIHCAAVEAGLDAGPPPEEAKYTDLGTGRRSLNTLLNKLDAQMIEPKRLVLAIDEFEIIETGIKEKRIDAGLLPYLRSIHQEYQWLGLIFAGLHTLDEMGRDYQSAFYGQAEYLRVGYMEYDDALRLITQPHPDFALEYASELREELYRLTSGQPYLIQRLCWELVTRWNERFLKEGETTPRTLTMDDLAPVLTPDFYHSAGYYFDGVWSNVTENERVLMRLMAQREKGAWTQAELAEAVKTIPAFEQAHTLEKTLELLRRHDVIAEEKEGTRIASELLRLWLSGKEGD